MLTGLSSAPAALRGFRFRAAADELTKANTTVATDDEGKAKTQYTQNMRNKPTTGRTRVAWAADELKKQKQRWVSVGSGDGQRRKSKKAIHTEHAN